MCGNPGPLPEIQSHDSLAKLTGGVFSKVGTMQNLSGDLHGLAMEEAQVIEVVDRRLGE